MEAILNIKALVSNESCFQKVRELRWADGVICPDCDSSDVIKRGKSGSQSARQRFKGSASLIFSSKEFAI